MKMLLTALSWMLALLLQGCTARPPAEPADLVLHNAAVYTLSWPDPAPDGTLNAAAPWRQGWSIPMICQT